MAVKPAAKKSFAVPKVCDLDMTAHENIAMCVRSLLPVGEVYGEVALDRLDAVQDRVPENKLSQAMETRSIIKESCFEVAQSTRVFYDVGKTDQATEKGAEALMRCFFYAGRVLENFGAGKQGKRLSNAASRTFWGLYRDDEFLIPPPDLFLGPR